MQGWLHNQCRTLDKNNQGEISLTQNAKRTHPWDNECPLYAPLLINPTHALPLPESKPSDVENRDIYILPTVGYSFATNEGDYAAKEGMPKVGYSFAANEGYGAKTPEVKVPEVGYSFAANEGYGREKEAKKVPKVGYSFAANEGYEKGKGKAVPDVGYSFAANQGEYKSVDKEVLLPEVGYSFAANEGYKGKPE